MSEERNCRTCGHNSPNTASGKTECPGLHGGPSCIDNYINWIPIKKETDNDDWGWS